MIPTTAFARRHAVSHARTRNRRRYVATSSDTYQTVGMFAYMERLFLCFFDARTFDYHASLPSVKSAWSEIATFNPHQQLVVGKLRLNVAIIPRHLPLEWLMGTSKQPPSSRSQGRGLRTAHRFASLARFTL